MLETKKFDSMKEEAQSAITDASTENELAEAKAKFLGKKSALSEFMGMMKSLTPEERKEAGKLANEFKGFIEGLIEKKNNDIHEKIIQKKLESEAIDVTLPGTKTPYGVLHPLQRTIRLVEDIFVGMGYTIPEGNELEDDLHNFELLNLPKGHPARDMQDTFYIDPIHLLRTQTSTMQAHTLLESHGEPVRIICPGKTYRRDNDDATHSHQFMQIEGLVVGEHITMADLKGTLQTTMSAIFGNKLAVRFRPSFFPFTEPSVEADVQCFKCGGKGCSLCKGEGWIEILGAGMVHPNVLTMCGYDATKLQGFAFGMGVERICMLRYGIDDIRQFYINDTRFLEQF